MIGSLATYIIVLWRRTRTKLIRGPSHTDLNMYPMSITFCHEVHFKDIQVKFHDVQIPHIYNEVAAFSLVYGLSRNNFSICMPILANFGREVHFIGIHVNFVDRQIPHIYNDVAALWLVYGFPRNNLSSWRPISVKFGREVHFTEMGVNIDRGHIPRIFHEIAVVWLVDWGPRNKLSICVSILWCMYLVSGCISEKVKFADDQHISWDCSTGFPRRNSLHIWRLFLVKFGEKLGSSSMVGIFKNDKMTLLCSDWSMADFGLIWSGNFGNSRHVRSWPDFANTE